MKSQFKLHSPNGINRTQKAARSITSACSISMQCSEQK